MIKTFGSDPEFLLYDKIKDKYVSSIGYIPGSKNEPVELTKLGEGYTIQKDNVLAEFCIPPEKSIDYLWNSIQLVLKFTQDNLLPPYMKLIAATGATFSDEDLLDPDTRNFGCSESYNAWTEDINPKPSAKTNYRGAGFHIHFGIENEYNNFEDNIRFIKNLDLFAGVMSVVLDSDNNRRESYGRAGEFRPTSYGIEYRVLPSSMLRDKQTFNCITRAVKKAIQETVNGLNLSTEDSVKIQACINTHNIGIAHELITKFEMHSILEEVFYFE